jgi:hypothetical protein
MQKNETLEKNIRRRMKEFQMLEQPLKLNISLSTFGIRDLCRQI